MLFDTGAAACPKTPALSVPELVDSMHLIFATVPAQNHMIVGNRAQRHELILHALRIRAARDRLGHAPQPKTGPTL